MRLRSNINFRKNLMLLVKMEIKMEKFDECGENKRRRARTDIKSKFLQRHYQRSIVPQLHYRENTQTN